ncbi:FixH family protein [Roseivirga sp.]|uniref:FixH family protein n=1 Tax=Roseivirga sp. TaxID=1964215 RepID=UPI003B525F49
MNWGNRIILAFVLFFGVVFTMVYISMNTEFSLVADNYYEQELAYEDQINRIRNVNNLAEKPEFSIDRSALKVSLKFPEAIAEGIKEGKVKFYRSSSSRHDQETELQLNEDMEYVKDISQMVTGAWKIQLFWTDGEKEYYQEIEFVI